MPHENRGGDQQTRGTDTDRADLDHVDREVREHLGKRIAELSVDFNPPVLECQRFLEMSRPSSSVIVRLAS